MGARSFYVYILASRIGGTLYIGVTNDLIRRVAEHRLELVDGFTKKYDVHRLVYFEQFDDIEKRDQSREAAEEMAARVEDFTDRKRQPELDRSLSRDCGRGRIGLWNTGSPGQAGR
jgi:putative endonuclease